VRYMVMHYQTQDMEDGIMPSPETQAAIEEYLHEAATSGVLLSGEGCFPAQPVHGSRSPTGRSGSSTAPSRKLKS
jgi:hypothetical protein